MLRISVLLCLLISTALGVAAQSDSPLASRPRLHLVEKPVIIDEPARAGEETIIWRSGENILSPLTPGAVLKLVLDSNLTTKKMKKGQVVGRSLQLRSPIENPYGGKYADRDFLVESEISGHSSGFKRLAFLKIEPKQILVEVRSTDYIIVGRENGEYIVLKPGKWRFDLACSLKQVVPPDGGAWNIDDEAVGIKGNPWGSENQSRVPEDVFGPLSNFNPAGPVIYGIAELRKLGKLLIHRPDIELPAGTDIYFRIEKLSATYIGPSTPKVPMEPKNVEP